MKIKNIFLGAVLFFSMALGSGIAASVSELNADQAWQKLMDGNLRFEQAAPTHPNQSTARRNEVAQGQKPLAVLVCCSDSRVPPELIFDQGLGDVFVVRTAGNVVDNVGLGSIEYAAEHLGTPLVVVLGHKRCGAVSAAVSGGELHGHIESVVKAIEPAVAKAKSEQGNLVENAVRENILLVVNQLKTSEPVLKKLVEEGKLQVVGAYYDLDTGKVEKL